MKIAAVVILYNPPEATLFNIKTYYDHVDKIFVFDNTEGATQATEEFKNLPKISLYHDFENRGIAKRLNDACKTAIKENYEWLLTMDQDTCFSQDAISNYFDCFYSFEGKEKVAMFGPEFSRYGNTANKACSATEVDKLITSGSLLNLTLFKKVGDFDESLFIDSVDYDYCFRSIINGFSIIQFSNVYIFHPVGNEVYRSSLKTLFLFKKRKEVHSPLRLYYMYRNMLFLQNKYKDQDKKFSKQIKDYVLSRIKVCLLYGRNTWKIIKYLRAAKRDFKNNNMGKIKKDWY